MLSFLAFLFGLSAYEVWVGLLMMKYTTIAFPIISGIQTPVLYVTQTVYVYLTTSFSDFFERNVNKLFLLIIMFYIPFFILDW